MSDDNTEAQIIDEVMAEWKSGPEGSIAVRAIAWMIGELQKTHGSEMTVDHVRDALSRLEQNAETISGRLWHRKREYLLKQKTNAANSH